MDAVLPDPESEFGARVAGRLREEAVAWLTVVDGRGRPQPAPIWFLWDGKTALIYSDGRAKRLGHLRERPEVAMHFDGNGQGGDIVVLTGTAVEAPDAPAVPDNPDYLAKYGPGSRTAPGARPRCSRRRSRYRCGSDRTGYAGTDRRRPIRHARDGRLIHRQDSSSMAAGRC